MKRLLILLLALGFWSQPVFSQKKKQPEAESRAKKIENKKPKPSKAGKTNPKEKGSGMTVPKQDQPKLDRRPNPAASVPERKIPADSGQP